MAECGRLGPRGGWARILVAFVTGIFLAGCVSVETIKKREKESEGYYQQGLSVLDTDQQRAFVSFQKAIQSNPNNYDAHYLLGHVYFLRKEYTDAEREFRTCVSLDPNNGEALNYRGRTLIFMSRLPEAIAYRESLKINPPNVPRALVYLELGRLHMQQGEDGKAREAFAQVKTLDPQGTAGAEATKMMKQLR